METFIFSLGILLLCCGCISMICFSVNVGYPQYYSKETKNEIGPFYRYVITSFIGLYLIGPSVIAGSMYLSIFPICYFIGRKKKVIKNE